MIKAISEHKPQTAERFFIRLFSNIVSDSLKSKEVLENEKNYFGHFYYCYGFCIERVGAIFADF